jgi:hypothetical protein
MKEKCIELLKSTNREGIDELISWLESSGFFQSPASTKYHGCFSGGLLKHSMNVYDLLVNFNDQIKLNIPQDSMIIASLLHDVCKVGAYLGSSKPYQWNKKHPKGHAVLSIGIIKKFIQLTDLEEKMIQYHMGVYGLNEFDGKGEYTLRGGGLANAWYHFPAVKIIYFCDEIATLQEKVNETN